ncbi:MAG: hypothetical protein V7K35_01465 [Nostoc sp.]|uniref:hypothetical protein n=1 Tax=Nostoc sp. TaxID=1180 RepID=UPI002FFAE7E5
MASDANSVFGNSLGGTQPSNLSDPFAPGGAFGIPTANSFDFDKYGIPKEGSFDPTKYGIPKEGSFDPTKYGIPKEGSFNLGSSVIPTSNSFDPTKYGIPNEGSLNIGSPTNGSIPNLGASNSPFPIA